MAAGNPRPNEEKVFSNFCKLIGLPFDRFISPPNDGAPDFVDPVTSLAVELTHYFSRINTDGGSLERATEKGVIRFLDAALACYEARSNIRMDLFVSLHDNSWVTRPSERSRRATELANEVLQHVGESVEWSLQELPPALSSWCCWLNLAPTPTYQELPLWQEPKAAILEARPESIQYAIDDKEPKLNSYRTAADVVWLLVHSTNRPTVGAPRGGWASSVGRLTRECIEREYVSSFDRVYFYDEDSDVVTELRVRPP